MSLRSRTLSLVLASFATAALVVAAPLVVAPAVAATAGAGISGITPYGGYLGNYIAPDGSRVYCIDANLDWPSGGTGPGSVTSSLTTSWGEPLSATTLQKLNYALSRFGQTADNVQAAAISAYVYAYTSGYAHLHGAGFEAGLHYIDGNVDVAGWYAAIWVDAEENYASSQPPAASITIDMSDPLAGTVHVATTPEAAVGTLTLDGAVVADSKDTSIAVVGGDSIEITGAPEVGAESYLIAASATFQAQSGSGSEITVYYTGDQQRTIRDAGPSRVDFASSTQLEVELPVEVVPSLPPEVHTPEVEAPVAQLAETGSTPLGLVGAALGLLGIGGSIPALRSLRQGSVREYRHGSRVIPSRE